MSPTKPRPIQLDSFAQLATIRLALLSWEAHSIREAKAMRELAAHFDGETETERKCEANAKASEDFAAEARALLDSGKLY